MEHGLILDKKKHIKPQRALPRFKTTQCATFTGIWKPLTFLYQFCRITDLKLCSQGVNSFAVLWYLPAETADVCDSLLSLSQWCNAINTTLLFLIVVRLS